MTRLRGGGLAISIVAAFCIVAMAHDDRAAAIEGDTIDGQYSGAGMLVAGEQSTMTVVGRGGVPATGVAAVALNVTVTEPTAASFLTVWPSGAARPLASNLNFTAGETIANSVLTKVGTDGKVALFNAAGSTHVVIDVVGWFPDNGSYHALEPARLNDTRDLPTIDGLFRNTGAIGQGATRDVTVVGRGGVPATGVGAVALNVTAVDPTLPSYVTVFPTGTTRPTASNLNTVVGKTVPNMVVAKVGSGGQISIYNNTGSVDVVVDVLGWFPAGSAFTSMVPARLLDTRTVHSQLDGGVGRDVAIGGALDGPPSNAAAVILNVTAVQPSGAGFLTVWPSGTAQPTASSVNFTAGQIVPNLVAVKLGANGKVSLFSPTPTDVVIDVLGWFPASGSFTGLVPARLMDTRGDATTAVKQLQPGTSWQWQIDGKAIDETVLDAVSNPQKMFDIDLFTNEAAVIQRLHGKGIYVVCYVETGSWENYRPDASAYPASVLGNPLTGYPNERLVDIRQIAVLRPIIAARLDLAKAKGCDGIEPDLDDTYSGYSSGFPLTMQHQLTFNKMVADLSHQRGMSIGLKNGATNGGAFEAAMEKFTDWALNEQCNQFGECAGYAAYIAHGKPVFQVEYLAEGATQATVCPADNAANFDGLIKQSSSSLGAQPRIACRFG